MSLKDGIAVFNGATTKQEIPVCVSFVLMHLCNSPKSLMEKKKVLLCIQELVTFNERSN